MKTIIYIGDFDLSNKNVQSHLVVSNCLIFQQLGYHVFLIGVNRNKTSWDNVEKLVNDNNAIAGVNGGLYQSDSNKGGHPLGVVVSDGQIQYNKGRISNSIGDTK